MTTTIAPAARTLTLSGLSPAASVAAFAGGAKTLLLSTWLTLACMASVPTAGAPASPSFEQAQERLEQGHYADAHRLFALLADCGHRESARLALQMRQDGARRYGMNFTVGPKRLARWRSLLATPAATSPSAAAACRQPETDERPSMHDEHWRHQGVG